MAGQKLLEDEFTGVHESGIRIERVGGLTVWEAQPVLKHQTTVDRIRGTIHPHVGNGEGCECIHLADVSLAFPDGSQKRPDIAIYCRMPDDEESESAITLIPEAVIEVISKGYEAKDYEVGVPFYIAQGVKDVLTVDPRTKEVRHYKHGEVLHFISPVEIILECRCVCTV
jgi:hypothetical protein